MIMENEMYHAAIKILENRAYQLSDDELEHHGILGMKWGVRRYQNEDGSLTPEGERRYLQLSERERLANIDASERGRNAGRFGALGTSFAVGEVIADKKRRDKMTDEEYFEDIQKSFAKNKKANKFGSTLAGINYGSAIGGIIGGLGGLGIGELIGNDSVAIGGIIAGELLGGATGGIIGNKTADQKYDKRHAEMLNDDNFAYRKRTGKELREYDQNNR